MQRAQTAPTGSRQVFKDTGRDFDSSGSRGSDAFDHGFRATRSLPIAVAQALKPADIQAARSRTKENLNEHEPRATPSDHNRKLVSPHRRRAQHPAATTII
ncbi:MAG: hypothetical protein JJT96_03260 [Opitutales bacterium]|nr:hypothetical protein [Opitutales bacterium]